MFNRSYVRTIVVVICLAAIYGGQGVNAQPSESELKAALLYNFAKFVKWPSNDPRADDSTFVIGIIGDSPIQELLEKSVEGKQIRKQRVKVRAISDHDSLNACKMLFVGSSEKDEYESILELVADKPILTVGELADFADAGGIIGFYRKDNMIRFKINVEAATRASLNISSKLLRLARIVE